MRQCFTHQAGLAERMGHCSPSSKNSCDFQHFMPFDLLFERKKNPFICSVSSHRCGTTLGTALGFCTRVAEPRDFVPVAEDGWVQEGGRGCRGAGEGTRSGHAVAMHPKLASWKYPPLSLSFVNVLLLQSTCPVATMELCCGFVLELRSFLEEGFRENHLCRTWTYWVEPGA